MQLVRDEDPQALEWIVRCYSERVLFAARRHCRTADEARDAVQDTWLAAAENLPAFRGDGSLEGWLVRIVAHACHRIGRGQKNDPARHDTRAALLDTMSSPEARAGERELGRALEQALAELEATDRTIVLLAEVEAWTASEISARLGLSSGAVRTRLTRLRSRLRDALMPVLGGGS